MTERPRRSALFMPASNARAIEKARGLACDVVILDLEDAVAPDAKGDARAQAVAAVRAGGFGARELVVRVNAPGTPWHADDLSAVKDARPDAVLVPKVADARTLALARRGVGDLHLWAMIETARGVLAARSIAEEAAALVVGPNDLALDLRCRPGADRAALVPHLAQVVLAARAAGITVLDGVCNAIDDTDRLAAECAQGRALGFDGKTLIHPAQIAAANDAFGPSEEEVAEARAIVAAFDAPEHRGAGAIKLDGRMVELLHRDAARRTLALVEAIGGRGQAPAVGTVQRKKLDPGSRPG